MMQSIKDMANQAAETAFDNLELPPDTKERFLREHLVAFSRQYPALMAKHGEHTALVQIFAWARAFADQHMASRSWVREQTETLAAIRRLAR